MKELDDIVAIQCEYGNWNHDPYMLGLANGLILAQSIVEGTTPVYLEKPDIWLKDIDTGERQCSSYG